MDYSLKEKLFSKLPQVIILVSLFISVSSCIQSPSNSRTVQSQSVGDTATADGADIGHASTNPDTDSDIDQDVVDDDTDTSTTAVEVRWLVDPFDGTYQSKLTIPKNFEGVLYIAVNGASTLDDAFVDVRFNFGLHSSPVTVEATVAKAINGGITPQTDVKVLVLNFSDSPFKDLSLSYDLFDYNDYGTDDVPVSDPRDIGLYCRGLRLEDDPTFTQSGATGCIADGDTCLFAYAKINDSTLYQSGTVPDPTSAQVDSIGNGYALQPIATTRTKCLPDTADIDTIRSLFYGGSSENFTYGSTDITLEGEVFEFLGPYYPSSASLWQITDDAVEGSKGIFQARFSNAPTSGDYWWSKAGYRSLLFPLAGTTELKSGVQYYGSSDPFPTSQKRAITQLSSDGDSLYMDGCNIRTLNRYDYKSESIAACNVVASIEIVATRRGDDQTVTEEVVAKSQDIKLQVIRASSTDYAGDEEVITSFKTCNNSNECGGDECCFNDRCWSKSIVSQCIEETDEFMTGGNGSDCSSDFACQSLCCSSTGTCKEHKVSDDGDVLCKKSPGQSCVSKEYCNTESVQVCEIYKIPGSTIDGETQCKVYCLPETIYGDCVAGYCRSPETPDPEVLTDDYDCSSAPDLPDS